VPHSDERLRPWIAEQLSELPVAKTVVDVGAGAGTWRDFLGPRIPDAKWTAIEVWGPYLEMFALEQRYDQVILGDARDVDLPVADLYIFGDVLEHMPAEDAIVLWERARKIAKWLVINLPVRRYEQGALFGNPHEVHAHHWDVPAVLKSFPGIISSHSGFPDEGSVVGAFIARGDGAESI
jgi:SAM-dependent methyltransferase